MKYRFSVSDVILAHKCPAHFYLKKIGVNAYFSFPKNRNIGTFVHKVLSHFANSVKTETLFTENQKESFIEYKLYESFKAVSFTTKYRVDYAKAWKYIESTGAYFKMLCGDKSEEYVREMLLLSEEPFKISIENAIIRGKFDLLMKTDNNIRIIDYKTRSENIEIDAIQIALYKFAVEELYGIKVKPVVVYIEEGGIKEEEFTDAEFREILKQTKSIVREMKLYMSGEKIPPKSMDREVCTHCNLAYNCKKIREEVFNE